MHLNDAFGHHPGLKCIYNHHEQACAIAAEGYTRYSGRLAGVCVTSGPGGTNALTGVLGGWLDSIPMFVVSGQVKKETTIWSTDVPLRQLGDQEYNIIDSVRPMSKYAVMVTEPTEIAYHLEKAYYLATNGRGGPVWLDIPLDVQGAYIDTDKMNHYNDEKEANQWPPKVDQATINGVIDKIKEAKRPVIIVGSGIRLGKAHKEFIKVIEKLNVPIVTAWNAHDNLWDDHRLYCGRPGTMGNRGGNFVMESSDLIIVWGSRLNIRQISYNFRNFATHAYKIMVDIDQGELDKPTLKIDMKIHADIKDFLTELDKSEFVNVNPVHEKWLKWCREINQKYPVCLPEYYEKKTPVNPYVFMNELFTMLPEGETTVCGNGTACVVTFQGAIVKKGQILFANSGCASMGYGLPAALGVAVYKDGDRVICLDGDGSFQMNMQEMQTIVHNKLNIKLFYLNNSGYHSIRQTQSNLFGNHPLAGVSAENGISFPSCEKIATCYDVPYFRLDNVDTAKNVITQAINTVGPVICEVLLDYAQYFEPKLSSKVLTTGEIISPLIDDMYPFIDRNEYDQIKELVYKEE